MTEINTKRELLVAVIESTADENIKAFAENEIAKLDATNAKRREKQAEKNDEKIEEVKGFAAKYLNDTEKTATMLKDELIADGYERADEKAVNVQFVSSLCRKAVDLGLAKATDVKITGKGTQKAYTVA